MRNIILSALTVLALTASAASPYKPSPYYTQRATLFEVLPIDQADIVMLGNSITDGCEWNELFGRPNIKNRGISGDITQGVIDRLEPIVKGQPAKIFMMIGINDLSRDITPDSVLCNIIKIADFIRKNTPNTKLYVESVLPVDESYGRYKGIVGKDNDVVALNKLISAAAKDLRYTYIDLYSSFADDKGHLNAAYTNDGLHLNGEGYLLWRSILLPYLDL